LELEFFIRFFSVSHQFVDQHAVCTSAATGAVAVAASGGSGGCAGGSSGHSTAPGDSRLHCLSGLFKRQQLFC
jgi:hypothetical protein